MYASWAERDAAARAVAAGPRLPGDAVWVPDSTRGGAADVARRCTVRERDAASGQLLVARDGAPPRWVDEAAVSPAMCAELAGAPRGEDLAALRAHTPGATGEWAREHGAAAERAAAEAAAASADARIDVEMWRLAETIGSVARLARAYDVGDVDAALLRGVTGPLAASDVVGAAFHELIADSIATDVYEAWIRWQAPPHWTAPALARNHEAREATARAARAWVWGVGMARVAGGATLEAARRGESSWTLP